MMVSRAVVSLIFLLYFRGHLLCQTCPVKCKCEYDEVRCVVPQATDYSFTDFASLRNTSHLYSRLVLAGSGLQRVSLTAALSFLRHVTYIDLSRNNFSDVADIDLSALLRRNALVSVNLSHNLIRYIDFCDESFEFLRRVKNLSLRANHIGIINFTTSSCGSILDTPLPLHYLDLSSNRFDYFKLSELLRYFPNMRELNLSSCDIRKLISSKTGGATPKLKELDVSKNDFKTFDLGHRILSLRTVHLGSNRRLEGINPRGLRSVVSLLAPNCPKLRGFDPDAGIRHLKTLDLRGSTGLRNLDLSLYNDLKNIFLSRSNISYLLPPVSWNTRQPGSLDISNTHNWNCSCNIMWVSGFARPKTALCSSPSSRAGLRIPRNLSICTKPQILNFTNLSVYGLGEKAKLECRVGGRPHPIVIWKTPSETSHFYRRLTTKRYHSSEETQGSLFHHKHYWHGSHIYNYKLERDKKLFYYVLTDGSLYIDYVTRTDAGLYSCTVLSPLGNHSLTMELRLNYDILRAVRWHSQIVGMVCAGCMLGIGFTIGVVRLIMRRCRAEERKKRNRTLKALLENMESYRADKFDKLRAYKSNKMDQLRDNYAGQVMRIKESCYTHMLNMQDHYNRRITKIRDNYETKIERLRDSYSGQMMRIKDYRSHQVERMRDNYNQQILRIREYASVQLMRLREQYRMQQHFFIKLLETLNLENCMAVDEDELDDAMARGAEVLSDTDEDDDELTARVLDPQSILAHMGSTHPCDLESRFPLHSLPSLPALPDLDCFVPPEFQRRGSGDDCHEAEMSPLRSASPVSEDYLTADSEYDLPAPPYDDRSAYDHSRVEVVLHDARLMAAAESFATESV